MERQKICARQDCSNSFITHDDRKLFCSRSCAAIENNKRRYVEARCQNCNIVLNKTKYARRFCSKKCKDEYPIKQWMLGNWNGTVKYGLSTTIRKYLLEKANYKCQDGRSGCSNWSGINPISGKSCLTIDHIDGDVYNNKMSNLIVICPNCHSMTDTYGSLNRGNGRKMRYNIRTIG